MGRVHVSAASSADLLQTRTTSQKFAAQGSIFKRPSSAVLLVKHFEQSLAKRCKVLLGCSAFGEVAGDILLMRKKSLYVLQFMHGIRAANLPRRYLDHAT